MLLQNFFMAELESSHVVLQTNLQENKKYVEVIFQYYIKLLEIFGLKKHFCYLT